MRNKKRIERLERDVDYVVRRIKETIMFNTDLKEKVEALEKSKILLENKIEIIEKNTKALFGEYVIGTNNLVCPVCGDKVYLVIDERYKGCVAGLHKRKYIEDNGTFVYKIKCKNHCVGVRDENILSAINKFKSLKVGDDNEESGTTL